MLKFGAKVYNGQNKKLPPYNRRSRTFIKLSVQWIALKMVDKGEFTSYIHQPTQPYTKLY